MKETDKRGYTRIVRRGRRVTAAALCLALAAGSALAAASNVTDKPPPGPGETSKNDESKGDPVSVMTGAVFFEQTDVSVPCPGVPLVFSRDYRSKRKRGRIGTNGQMGFSDSGGGGRDKRTKGVFRIGGADSGERL